MQFALSLKALLSLILQSCGYRLNARPCQKMPGVIQSCATQKLRTQTTTGIKAGLLRPKSKVTHQPGPNEKSCEQGGPLTVAPCLTRRPRIYSSTGL